MNMTSDMNTKDKLCLSALSLFAEKGFMGTTTKEICDTAKVNSASITYHFGSKENLLVAILKKHFNDIEATALDIVLEAPRSREEFKVKIELFFNANIDHFKHDEAFHKFIIREGDINPLVFKVLKELIHNHHKIINNFFKGAQKNKIISGKLDTGLLTHAFMGLFMSHTRHAAPMQIFPELNFKNLKNRKQYLDMAMSIFLDGIFTEEKK